MANYENTSIAFDGGRCINYNFINNSETSDSLRVSNSHRDVLDGQFIWNVPRNDHLGKGVLTHEPHLTNFIQLFLDKGDWVLDIGACFGLHSLSMAKCVGIFGKVFAFEPQTKMISFLKQNIQDNHLSNIQVMETALGDVCKQTCICTASDLSNCGTAFISLDYTQDAYEDLRRYDSINRGCGFLPIEKELIQCNRLDSFLELFTQKIKFVKIDVEGFERMVMQGGVEFFEIHRPVMVVELEESLTISHGYDSKSLIEHIRAMRYTILFLDYSYPSDHLCIPNELCPEFQQKFGMYIKPHTEDNSLNHNFRNGVVYKFSYE
jgi:FkbM family methyltransferase